MIKPVLVDSNVLIDIFSDDREWAQWSHDTLVRLSDSARLFINPVIYSEISIGFRRIESLEGCLSLLLIDMRPVPKEALFLAGKVFLDHRKSDGTKTSTLPDFFIGAHAAVADWRLVTRDSRRVGHYFPTVEVVCP